MDSWFQVLDSSLCHWNLDSGFQSLVAFRIPWAVFRIRKPRIPDSKRKCFPDSGIRFPCGWDSSYTPGGQRSLSFTSSILGAIHSNKYRPVRPRKVVHLKRWTSFFETFPVGPNRSIEVWSEISRNFGRMDHPLWFIRERLCMNLVRSLLSMRGMLLGYSFQPRPNSHVLATDSSVTTIGLS